MLTPSQLVGVLLVPAFVLVFVTWAAASVYLLLTQSTLPRETNVANCIARMGQIPGLIKVARRTLKNPPRVHTETAIKQNRGAISFYEG